MTIADDLTLKNKIFVCEKEAYWLISNEISKRRWNQCVKRLKYLNESFFFY